MRLMSCPGRKKSGGRLPVIMDASTCKVRMQKHLAGRPEALGFHEFAHDALLPRLLLKKPGPVALHVNCSVRKMPPTPSCAGSLPPVSSVVDRPG